MKLIALAAAAASLVITASVGARASASPPASLTGASHFSLRLTIPTRHGLLVRRVVVPLQAAPTSTAPASTATSQATAGASATPEASPTQSPYPDPVTVLNNTFNVFGHITQVHWEDIITGDQTNVEHLSVDAKGPANCTSELGTVKGTDTVLGTSQKSSTHYEFIQKGNKYYKKSLTGAHKTWKKSKAQSVAAFGTFDFPNPLACPSPSTSTGGSGGGSDTLTDLVNQGPATYHGVKTWHLTATDVSTDGQGNTTDLGIDFYISQDHFLPYGYRATINDPSNNITLISEQVMTKFGKKVSIPTPKIGATTP